ncbi:hypothetical protein CAPTEDRAFT_73422, partial [Capitella teleta]
EIGLKVTTYAVVMLAALLGNSLVIFIVFRNQRMRTTTNFYLVNLAVADLLVTLMCSWVHLVDSLTENWVLGAFFCRANSFAQVLALVSSILTLTLIACDRFFGIMFAMRAHLTERRASCCLVVVWVCAAGVAAPLLFFRSEHHRVWLDFLEVWCNDDWPSTVQTDMEGRIVGYEYQSKTIYYTFVCVVLFFVPILVMATAYGLIIRKLWSTSLPGEHIESGKAVQDKTKKKVAAMLIVLLCIFVLCWLPLQCVILYAEYRSPHTTVSISIRIQNYYIIYFSTFIAYSNSALNPLIYAGFNENFRRG